MPAVTNGLINADKPKPPEPKPSPKEFVWPTHATAKEKERQAFAATLQELLPTKNWKHTDLSRTLWGAAKDGIPRNSGKPRDWVKAGGYFPSLTEASYVAQIFGVSLQRLLEPKVKFDPMSPMVRLMRPRSEWKSKGEPVSKLEVKRKPKAKANGHAPEDTRWVLPPGVAAPTVKFETSKKHQSLVMLTLQGEMPLEVAMAIMSMANAKSGD